MVNLFFSSIVWTRPRNKDGTRHHVFDVYTTAFSADRCRIYPARLFNNWIAEAVYHAFLIGPASVNVVTPGYPMLSAYFALHFVGSAKVIVHTWKIPGHTAPRWTARVYDHILNYLIEKACLVVVASRKQLAQVTERYPGMPVFFAPVTVDCRFWSPETEMDGDGGRLNALGIKQRGFVLTVGDSDRDEELGVGIARKLGRPYVRVTKDRGQVALLRQAEEKCHPAVPATVLYDVSDEDLRALYRAASVVSLPTVTRTNPAGLSALTEAMACGAVVLAPEDLCEGYITDRVTGVTFGAWDAGEAAQKILRMTSDEHKAIAMAARKFAMEHLNGERVAIGLRAALHGALGGHER